MSAIRPIDLLTPHSQTRVAEGMRLERAMRQDHGFLDYVEEFTSLVMDNAASIQDEDKKSNELAGMDLIILMIRNSKGWPIADGGVGKLSRTDSITFYESVFTTARIAAVVEPRKIPRSSAPSSSSEENL